MELNKLAFTTQPRTAWQVLDLTQLFVRENFFSLVTIYLLTLLPIALISIISFSFSSASLIIWWFKPLFERPLLTYLSKRCFHQPCTVWQAIGSLKQLGIGTIIKMLTIYRFSPNRAYLSAVEQLEKQKGLSAVSRKNLLKSRIDHKQTLWMLLCVHLEMLLTLILLLIIFNFIPAGISFDSQFLQSSLNSQSAEIIYFTCYLISIALIAPYFVTGGFLMYLNARIIIEAWDIELIFKGITARLSSINTLMLPLILLFTLSLTSPKPGYANTKAIETHTKSAQQIKAQVEEIYQQHHLIEKKTTWKPRNENKTSQSLPSWLAKIKNFFNLLASISPFIGYLMWIIVAILALWLAKQLYKYRRRFFISPTKKPEKLKPIDLPVFFAEVKQESLPKDLLVAAEQALQQQEYRQSLRYLLWFALQLAEKNSLFTCHKSMTEKECEQALLAVLPAKQHNTYRQLFLYWIQQAWAHKALTEPQIRQLIVDFKQLASEQSNG
jgi:hypothetical protein